MERIAGPLRMTVEAAIVEGANGRRLLGRICVRCARKCCVIICVWCDGGGGHQKWGAQQDGGFSGGNRIVLCEWMVGRSCSGVVCVSAPSWDSNRFGQLKCGLCERAGLQQAARSLRWLALLNRQMAALISC